MAHSHEASCNSLKGLSVRLLIKVINGRLLMGKSLLNKLH